MSDSSENSQAAEETGLRIVRDSSLALLPKGSTPALEEMVGRSLAQIRATPASGMNQSGCELVVGLRAGDEREFEIAPGVKIVMCWIPPGEFLMGCPEYEEGRGPSQKQHQVRITQGFWLAKTPTTQAQWKAVMGNNPSHFRGDDLPVETVNWYDICGGKSRTKGFFEKLNEFGSAVTKFDLPTEAQWEYACRAGTTGPYAGDLEKMAWHGGNSGGKTHPVGLKMSNNWGLHDVHGNVLEWCSDWSGYYDVNVVEDPKGPVSASDRMIRGGSWHHDPIICRAACRNSIIPDQAYDILGFRIARSS